MPDTKSSHKPAKPETSKPVEKKEPVLGTAEMAAKLKIEPRYLRVVLRASGKGSNGERYEWHEKDVPKLREMIEAYEAKAAEKAKVSKKDAGHDKQS